MKKQFLPVLAAALCACSLSDAALVDENINWEGSRWISAADAPVVTGKIDDKKNCRAADGAAWFVADVTNSGKVVSAKWMTAGLGVYELYLNGEIVGREVLKPGFTHYAKTKISYTYDITPAFVSAAGKVNTLSAQLTPGWWGDKIVTPSRHEGMIGRKCAFRSVLELVYADGTTERFCTDTINWKAGIAGPVKHAAIFDGEEYDAREPMGCQLREKLGTPETNNEFEGEILPTGGAEIYRREDLTLNPVEAYTWKDVDGADSLNFGKVVRIRTFAKGEQIIVNPGETLVVDFGQNCAGVPEFDFNAAEGTVLTCLPAELLNDGTGARSRGMDGPGGSCHRTNLRTPDKGMILSYTFAGKGWEHYSPRCTFFGYRFVSITATDAVKIKRLVTIPISSISKEMETGCVTTGNELVNKLISNTVWGQLSNYLSVTTDCPQRNERLGWTADTQVFTETGTFFANTAAFFHKWMRDMRDSQSDKGAFPGVAPRAQYGDDMMRLGWADAGVIVPWTIWKQFGDTRIIDENWDAMTKFVSHIEETKYDHAAIKDECRNYQWADWLSYEAFESHDPASFTRDADGKRQPIPELVAYWNYLAASYWLIDEGLMRDMALASGRDASRFEAGAAEARQYILDNFVNPDGTFRCDTLNTMQTPALFALRNGLFEGEAREGVIARLRENFKAHYNCLQTGFLGTSILMNTLTDNGMADIAYELLFQRRNPSWLYSVDNGATTIWERWNSYMIEKGMGPKGMNSFNHYAYGCVCEWIWKTACGIAADPAQPGFKHIIMKPVPDRRLGFVKASYKSAAGLITSEWKYEGDEWVWTFSVPSGSTSEVTLPGETQSKEYTSGSYTLRVALPE